MKQCTKCKQIKPRESFHRHNRSRDNLQAWCKSCASEYNHGHGKIIRIKRVYGLDEETFQSMKKDGCEVCGVQDNLCVDHSHKTGEIRGILCVSCNASEGHLQTPERAMALAAYMIEHESVPSWA